MGEPMDETTETLKEFNDPHVEQKVINEEYKIWKKNSVWLYDMLYAYWFPRRALEWPTLTTQWFPDKRPVEGTNLFQHRLLFGTNTSGSAQNYVQIATLEIPDLYSEEPDAANYNDQTGEIGGYGAAKAPFTFKIMQKINHPGEVNKARYMPQNPELFATMCPDGRILVFDRTKHELMPKTTEVKPEMELVGHEKEGFAMSWSWANEGKLVTGAEDKTVRVWDTKANYSKNSKTQRPIHEWTHHTACVNDVQHHPSHAYWVGTVSDDLTLQILDTRTGKTNEGLIQKQAHTDAVNALAFHPKYDTLVATASADKTIALWDLRNVKEKVHSFEGHRDSVIKLEFHPQRAHILASGSYDRRILIWNLANIGEEQTEEEMEDGPPELSFMHGGFTDNVCDFSWNMNDPWVMLGAAEDNQVQVFRPARKIVELPKKQATNKEIEE